MTMKNPGTPPMEDRAAHIELALIEEFMAAHGCDPAQLSELSGDERHRMLRQAAAYAAMKLAEIEARAHFVHELHGER